MFNNLRSSFALSSSSSSNPQRHVHWRSLSLAWCVCFSSLCQDLRIALHSCLLQFGRLMIFEVVFFLECATAPLLLLILLVIVIVLLVLILVVSASLNLHLALWNLYSPTAKWSIRMWQLWWVYEHILLTTSSFIICMRMATWVMHFMRRIGDQLCNRFSPLLYS